MDESAQVQQAGAASVQAPTAQANQVQQQVPPIATAQTQQVQQPLEQQAVQQTTQDDTGLDQLYNSTEPDPAATQTPQVPESYDFEGIDLKDNAYITQDREMVSTLGKELGLTNDQARKLLEKGSDVLNNNLAQKVQQNVKSWLAQVNADPQIGGANLAQTKLNVSRVIKKYDVDGAYEILKRSGIGAHPAVLKLFNNIGQALGEEHKFVNSAGTIPAPRKKNPYRAIYNNSPELNFGDD